MARLPTHLARMPRPLGRFRNSAARALDLPSTTAAALVPRKP
jgi:hypothetical protein